MKRQLLSCLFVVALAGPAYAAPKLVTSVDQSPEFKGYRTYTWVFTQIPTGMNPTTYDVVRRSIDQQLLAKGYQQAEPGEMAVGFSVGRRNKTEVIDYGAYGGTIYTRMGVRPAFDTVETKTVTEGTLAVDIYDVQSRQPVWRATASRVLPRHGADKTLVNEAVKALLGPLPAAR